MNDWVNIILKTPDKSMEYLVKFKDGTITGASYDIKSKYFEPIHVEILNGITNHDDDPQNDIDLNDHHEIGFYNQPTHWKFVE